MARCRSHERASIICPSCREALCIESADGDPGSALYLVTKGRASVHIRHDDGDIRLVTFAAGAVLGELALLDRGPRSATITVDQDLAGFGLSEPSFGELCQKQPDIAIKLLSALGRELSVRIRYANMTIQQLES